MFNFSKKKYTFWHFNSVKHSFKSAYFSSLDRCMVTMVTEVQHLLFRGSEFCELTLIPKPARLKLRSRLACEVCSRTRHTKHGFLNVLSAHSILPGQGGRGLFLFYSFQLRCASYSWKKFGLKCQSGVNLDVIELQPDTNWNYDQ